MDLAEHRQGVQIEYPGCFSQRDFATLGPLVVRVDRNAVRDAELLTRSTRRSISSGSTSTAKSGRSTTSSLMRASNLTVPTTPTLRPKLRKVPRKSFSMAMASIAAACGGSAASAASGCVTSSHAPTD